MKLPGVFITNSCRLTPFAYCFLKICISYKYIEHICGYIIAGGTQVFILRNTYRFHSRCKKCFCNNHGSICDPETGKCQCEHNTRGDNCQQCEIGYYGNPTAGTPNDCKPCPCLYGTECIGLTSGVRCTNCPDGHIGDFCEKCDDGYFGDPNGELGLKTR